MTLETLILIWLIASLLAGLIVGLLWFCLAVWQLNEWLALVVSVLPLLVLVWYMLVTL
ncbi:hypothetical protein [Streptococcus sp. sy010]|uniref:hypothetical protein n=1 Tax=Streptococcus sp. sy010 TaxID=2600148 RepID=UPI001646B6E2|nr:hypothetical protein [Streptococcus sp. sy010]